MLSNNKSNKMQVPPAELEHVLQSIPDIADAAVIPYVHVFLFSV